MIGNASCSQDDTVRAWVPTARRVLLWGVEKDDPVLEDRNVMIPTTEEEQACIDRKIAEGGDFDDTLACRREVLGDIGNLGGPR